ncbi:MAG: polysaccharide biosynthesis C-terminal domain-containing protein [Acidimicrobiales bacterium]
MPAEVDARHATGSEAGPPEPAPSPGGSVGSLVRAAAATFATQIGVGIVALAHIVVVARALGPDGRGELVFLTTTAGLAGFVSTLSAHEGLANQAGADPGRRGVLVANAAGLAAVLGGVGGLILFAVLGPLRLFAIVADPVAAAAAALAVPGIVAFSYLTYLTRANHAFGVANRALLAVSASLFAGDTILALSGHLTVRRAVVVWAGSYLVGCAPLVWHLVGRHGIHRPDLALAGASVRFGMKAHGAGLLNTGSYRMDTWLLGALAGAGPLGVYSVAVAWFETLFLLPTAYAAVARPSIVEADPAEVGERTESAFRLALIGVMVAGAGLALLAPAVCGWLFGADYASASTQLRLLVPGAIGIAAVKVLGGALTARGRPGLETAGVAVGFAVGAVAYLVLIPRFAAEGAAVATSLSYLTGGLATAAVFVRALGNGLSSLIPTRRDLTGLAHLARRS